MTGRRGWTSEAPERVRSCALRGLGHDAARAAQVRIAQEGEMWLRPGGRALRFVAIQRSATDRVAFAWRARFPLVGPLALHVLDRYERGEGELVVRAAGLRLQRKRGLEISRGEAVRYLAELPWVPAAVLRNRELEWSSGDDDTVSVATRVGGERVVARLEFDARGNVSRVSSEDRSFDANGWARTPWGGEFRAYATIGGLLVPTAAEVYWELDSGRFTYWRGRLTSIELVDEPFAG